MNTLCFSFDQSFEAVKQVFSAFNLYGRLFNILNKTTEFLTAAITEEDFENSTFGRVGGGVNR